MIGVPALVVAAVAAIFGHYVLAATVAVFGVAELAAWDVSGGGSKGRARQRPNDPPDGTGLDRGCTGGEPYAAVDRLPRRPARNRR